MDVEILFLLKSFCKASQNAKYNNLALISKGKKWCDASSKIERTESGFQMRLEV